jgi:hypothetical protein
MGEVIQFPDDASTMRGGRYIDASSEPATVIILPVIRVERDSDGTSADPTSGSGSGRRRRRRVAR